MPNPGIFDLFHGRFMLSVHKSHSRLTLIFHNLAFSQCLFTTMASWMRTSFYSYQCDVPAVLVMYIFSNLRSCTYRKKVTAETPKRRKAENIKSSKSKKPNEHKGTFTVESMVLPVQASGFQLAPYAFAGQLPQGSENRDL